jgi:hypothetical protein
MRVLRVRELWCGSTVFVVVIGFNVIRDIARERTPHARLRAGLLLVAILFGWFLWAPFLAYSVGQAGLPVEFQIVCFPVALTAAVVAGYFFSLFLGRWLFGEPANQHDEGNDDEPE